MTALAVAAPPLFSHPNALKIFGPAGAGKTRELIRILQEHVEDGDFRLQEGIIVSFTRAAAQDIARRVNPDGEPGKYHCTLHALCKRYYGFDGQPADVRIKEFFAEKRIPFVPTRSPDPEEWSPSEAAVKSEGALILAFWSMCRNRLLSLTEGKRLFAPEPEVQHWWAGNRMERLWEDYCAWKDREGIFDFTEMLEYARDNPPAATWPFFVLDEGQDSTPLQWQVANVFAAQSEVAYIAGDDDQCQPSETRVLTANRGEVRISELDPSVDRVVAYDRRGGALTGLRHGHPFSWASRPFKGPMLTFTAGDKQTRCTPNHRWLARWTDEAAGAHVVYLMRRGDHWRVGWCKLRRSDGVFHLGHRARLEKADAAWVLLVAKDRTDASVMESVIAARYGIPTATFEPVVGANHLTAEAIARIFDEVGNRLEQALECLGAFNREIAYPFWTPEDAAGKRGGSSVFEVRASNLLPGLMAIPMPAAGNAVAWASIESGRWNPFDSVVYSLAVERYQTYVADGLVTHNCIYNWAGASPNDFLTAGTAGTDILSVNHRSGGVLVDAAQQFIRQNRVRQDKNMTAARPGGAISTVYELPELDVTESMFVMARAHYLNEPVMEQLDEAGYPYVDKRGKFGVNGRTATQYQRWLRLGKGQAITLDEWRLLCDAIPSAGPWLLRGAKIRLKNMDAPARASAYVRARDLTSYGASETLVEALRAGSDDPLERLDRARLGYLRQVEQNFGIEYLDAAKAAAVCQVGPVHAFKGLEADHVILHCGMPPAATREAIRDPEPERRVIYVAMTRAKHRLTHFRDLSRVRWREIL